jgi:hypothetical protein
MKQLSAFLLFSVIACSLVGCAPAGTPVQTATASLAAPTREATPLPPTASPTVIPPTSTPTLAPAPTAEADFADRLQPAGRVWVFPGPVHYEGELLSLEIPIDADEIKGNPKVTLTLDEGPSFEAPSYSDFTPIFNSAILIVRDALDTSGLAGAHTLRIQGKIQSGGNSSATLTLDETISLEILPAAERPADQTDLAWQKREIDCCTLYFLDKTAAARDIEQIAADVSAAIGDVAARFRVEFEPQAFTFVFSDAVWGNGGFTADQQIYISYVDRDFQSNAGLAQPIRHEAAHAATMIIGPNYMTGPLLSEGIATYVAGGHMKPDPLPQRAAALVELGLYKPVDDTNEQWFSQQHEVRYLEAEAVVAYLVETYGWDRFIKFYKTNIERPNLSMNVWFDQALQKNFQMNTQTFEERLLAWLQSTPPGEQVEDVRLTVAVQNLRRQYQATYAPFTHSVAVENFISVEPLELFLREPSEPSNAAVECMFIAVQRLLAEKQYEAAQALLDEIEPVIHTGEFQSQLAADYLRVAQAVDQAGYEAVQIDFPTPDQAEAQVTLGGAQLETLQLSRSAALWEIVP